MNSVINLSELHKLLDLLVVERAVLSIVLADKVLKCTKDDKSIIFHHFNMFVVDYHKQNKTKKFQQKTLFIKLFRKTTLMLGIHGWNVLNIVLFTNLLQFSHWFQVHKFAFWMLSQVCCCWCNKQSNKCMCVFRKDLI